MPDLSGWMRSLTHIGLAKILVDESLTCCVSLVYVIVLKLMNHCMTHQCVDLCVGYSTLLSVLGVRCLPQHTFLQYVDHGLLQLTEPFVSRLMTGTNINTHLCILIYVVPKAVGLKQ